MTGTGIVPTSDFTLHPGDIVNITIDGVGTLSNPIVQGVDPTSQSTPPVRNHCHVLRDFRPFVPFLIAGQWRDADYEQTFQATDPNRNEKLAGRVSGQFVGGLRRGARCRGRGAVNCVDCRRPRSPSSSNATPTGSKLRKDALVEAALRRNRSGQEPALGRRRIAANQQPATCTPRPPADPVVGHCRRSTPRPEFDRATNRSARSVCLAPTIFRSRLAVSPVATLRPRSRPEIR